MLDGNANIRRCISGDEAALALIGQATFLETFAGILSGSSILGHCKNAHSEELYRQWLSDTCHALWLVEARPGDAPIGFMVLAPPDLPLPDTESDIELKRIYLLSKFQGSGIGKSLLRHAVEYANSQGARRLLLGVYANNDKAIAFYQHVGFRKLGTRKFNVGGSFYDDFVMGKDLTGPLLGPA